jgi:hypothetical protein
MIIDDLDSYADGTEELYDSKRDFHEWENLADKPRFDGAAISEKPASGIPRHNP